MTPEKLPMKPWKSASSDSRWMWTAGFSTSFCSKSAYVLAGVAAADGAAQLQGVAAELGRALHQVDVVTHLAERGGGRHAGDAAAHDDGGVRERHVDLVERLEHARPGDRHAHEVAGLVGRLLRLRVVHPARLIADVGHLEEVRVETGLAQGVLEDAARGCAAYSSPRRRG